jgi:serine/threonine protein kinase
LYSLGITLWEMLTGQTPFRGAPIEVMYQHQHASLPLDLLEAVPQPVVVLLEVLLEKDPGRRFQNPGELLKAIPMITAAVDTRHTVNRFSFRIALKMGRRDGQDLTFHSHPGNYFPLGAAPKDRASWHFWTAVLEFRTDWTSSHTDLRSPGCITD